MHEPWRSLRRRLYRAVGWALAVSVLSIAVMAVLAARPGLAGDALPQPEPTLAQAQTWGQFWLINARAYATLQVGALLLSWPVLRLCMLCGVAAARLRLLSHPRWRRWLRRWTLRLAPPLLLLNLGYGLAQTRVVTGSDRAFWVESIGGLIGLPLAAVYVMALALAANGGRAVWCLCLAPLGQRTLTLYVGHSLLCLGLFTAIGLGLQPSTAQMALFSLGLWCLALAAARASGARRWPLEAWLAKPAANK